VSRVQTNGTGVFEALARLDQLLLQGLAGAEVAYGADAAADPFRGLHLGIADVERLLEREPGEPVFSASEPGIAQAHHESLSSLAAHYGLNDFEADALLVALAPDVDLRYERVYAYLQDDVTMRRPTVDLILNLLCASADEKVARRSAFHPDAPLLRLRLVRLDGGESAPLLRRVVAADDQVVRMVLGTGGLDFRLAGCCELGTAPPAELQPDGASLRLYFRGRPGTGRRAAAEALAAAQGRRLLAADAELLPDGLAAILVREAALHDALLYVDRFDAFAERPRELVVLLEAVAGHSGPIVFAGERAWVAPVEAPPVGLHAVAFTVPDAGRRRAVWAAELDGSSAAVAADELDALAALFRLVPAQIATAVADARATARWRGDDVPGAADLFTAARARTGHALGDLATKVQPARSWEDLILPADSVQQLRELCARVVHREVVLDELGFARKLPLGRGVTALFSGPPGTGKTMGAEVIASALGLDLYLVDLAGVVSKWIGETEKNLDRIFSAAEDTNAILFFDEADALFGKRSEVQDSHDRYANIEVSYLLQKMDQLDGAAILATNKMDNLDEAFLRRLSFIVRFPFPSPDDRRRIWESVWPAETQVADDLDWGTLARDLSFSGAEIKNVALAAAFLAAEAGTLVTAEHVRHAVRREYEKAGRSVDEALSLPAIATSQERDDDSPSR
jgi:AAA+ superfamily predicted ATPase